MTESSGCDGPFRYAPSECLLGIPIYLREIVLPSTSAASQERTHKARGGMLHIRPRGKGRRLRWEQDVLYLTPIIREIEAERQERDDLEVMTIRKKKPAEAPTKSH